MKQYQASRKKFEVNMPKKLGLSPGKKYIFTETENGYSLRINTSEWIGMPKSVIESNPQLYTLIRHKNGE